MIRARREQDLEPLCVILRDLGRPAADMPEADLRGWLEEHEAEQSWVYDMAPMGVAPTRNVVGHVEIHRPSPALASAVAAHTGGLADDLLAIGKLVVRRDRHEHGFARHLLNQSVDWIRRYGRRPVLDLVDNVVTKEFCARYGFEEAPSDAPRVRVMIHAE